MLFLSHRQYNNGHIRYLKNKIRYLINTGKKWGGRKFGKFIDYLKRNNYIKTKALENKQGIILAQKGLLKAFNVGLKTDKKKREDGKWIMLIFDIPEKYKKSRRLLRSILKTLGYKIFQQSVWITPYDVSEKTEKLLQFYSLDKFVRIFLIEEIN